MSQNVVDNPFPHLKEGLGHILSTKGWSFIVEFYSIGFFELLDLVFGDFPMISKVCFVSHQYNPYLIVRVSFKFIEPVS